MQQPRDGDGGAGEAGRDGADGRGRAEGVEGFGGGGRGGEVEQDLGRVGRVHDPELAVGRAAAQREVLRVDGCDALRGGGALEERVAPLGPVRTERAEQQGLAVRRRPADPVAHHAEVPLGEAVEPHRILDDGKEHRENLLRGLFGRFMRIPLEHVGMHGGVARGEAQARRAGAVAEQVAGDVARADHVAEGADGRAHVGLAELDQDVGLRRDEAVKIEVA